MSEDTKIKAASEFPHNEWLAENAEFVKANLLPDKLKGTIQGFKLAYGRYAKLTDADKIETQHNKLLSTSLLMVSDMQDWFEKDLPEEEHEPTPAAVVIEDGIVTSDEEKEAARLKAEQEEAERLAAEQPKEEGGSGWGWLAAFALAALGIGVAVNKFKK